MLACGSQSEGEEEPLTCAGDALWDYVSASFFEKHGQQAHNMLKGYASDVLFSHISRFFP
jgi:hypothetical protein